jgi:hypothetical protein
VAEMFQRINLPKNKQRLVVRLKANSYYYRGNYAFTLASCTLLSVILRPLPLLALGLAGLAAKLASSDAFALGLSDRAYQILRQVHPPTAAKLRAASGHGAPGWVHFPASWTASRRQQSAPACRCSPPFC